MTTLHDTAPPRASTTPTHTAECDAAHEAAEVPRGEECADFGCWGVAETSPRATGVVETVIEHDPWGTFVRTPFGPLSWVEATDDEPEHVQLDGKGTHTLADAWELHEALGALLGSVDPGRLGRTDLAARQGRPPAPALPSLGRGSVADVASRLSASSAETLRRIVAGELVRSYGAPSWRGQRDDLIDARVVSVRVLDDLDALRRHGLVEGVEATELGRAVADHLTTNDLGSAA